jgi:DNA-binding transcriptional LysR family regulator
MNLEYLKTYIEVIKLGNFSEVGKKLSISQPAVSFQIQKIEHDLGVHLIDRSQKAVTMTEAGKRLLIFAKSIEGEWEKLLLDLEHLREDVTGELTIAASTIPGEFILPVFLGEFKALHPAVRAQVIVSDSLTVIDGVKDGKYELGFCGVIPSEKELESTKIGADEIILVVFPEHPFGKRKEINLNDLEGEPLIFRESTSGTQHSLEAPFSHAGFNFKKWTPHLILGTTQAVVSAVEAKAGIAFVSNLAVKKSLALGLVKQVNITGMALKRDFYCIYRKERIVSRLLKEFIIFVGSKVP